MCNAQRTVWTNEVVGLPGAQYHRTNLRDELLDRELFDILWEVKVLVERWRQTNNLIRPHNALCVAHSQPVSTAGTTDAPIHRVDLRFVSMLLIIIA